MGRAWLIVPALLAAACNDPVAPLATAEPGLVFVFPADQQLDVPLGARILVTFSDPVDESALSALTLRGPDGDVATTPVVSGEGRTVELTGAQLAPGVQYALTVDAALAPYATNLPTGALSTFTTRSTRPRAAAPTLIAVNGAPPTTPTAFRPMFETSTLRLVFSEPLDPRTAVYASGAIELFDTANNVVPATLLANGIHVAIDPVEDLVPGSPYTLRLGNLVRDLGGTQLEPATVALVPEDSRGAAPLAQVLRTRTDEDPPVRSRAGGATNVIAIDKPLIGSETSELLPVALAAEMGDAQALGGPIAFTLRKGQRLAASGLDIKLGGELPVGLTTGDIHIELLTDAGGRLYRNPHQAAEQRPENERAPLYVELSLDVAVYASDDRGTAVMSQTVLGVQGIGTAIASDGVLAIENMAAMDIALLGVTSAASNLTLELLTDPSGTIAPDSEAPTIIATSPDVGDTQPVDGGIEVIFSEPVDLQRIRAGGMRLETGSNTIVPAVFESHGATIVVRPLARLAYSTSYRLVMNDIADVAGNPLAAAQTMAFQTPRFVATDVPMMVTGIYPGAPCALTGANASGPGRCAGGASSDDIYHPFTLPADHAIHVTFSQTVTASTLTLGAACGAGSVRVEQVSAAGTCTSVVAGTLIKHDRALEFIPDVPWTEGQTYRLTLVSGNDDDCDANEICGYGQAASFDPLSGTDDNDGGGPNLIVPFTAGPPSSGTFLLKQAGPITDSNGNGFIDTGETLADGNRAGMAITSVTGAISEAVFTGGDCISTMPGAQNCMYLSGAMPLVIGELERDCALPDGSTALVCVPLQLSPQAMFATSVSMDARVVFNIGTDTGTSVMRIREPAAGPVRGVIVDKGGTPTLIAQLDLYMDAPDMAVALDLASHDLHSKPLAMTLEGPLTFLPDGRIAILAANTADLPVAVNISAIGIDGAVQMMVPAGQMKLRLVSPPLRGVSR